jgi:hypothetical protein
MTDVGSFSTMIERRSPNAGFAAAADASNVADGPRFP